MSHKRKEPPDSIEVKQPPEKKQRREARGLASLVHPDDTKSQQQEGERKVLPRQLSVEALLFACLTFVSTVLVRQRDRRQEGEAQKEPKKKQWRKKRPPEEECVALTEVEQNSPAWYAARSLSSGASSLYSFCGWSKHKLNTDQYREDAGLVSEPERSAEDCFFCDHGHHYEDEARLVAEFFLGCLAVTTGLWIHPMFPYAHASPDGLLVYAASAATWISACFAADALKGLMEIKCPIYGAYVARTRRYPWPHTIPVEYIIQQMAQMSCLNAPWSDFVVYWHANERKGLQPFEWTDKSVSCTQWKIAELLISRIWFNKELTRLIYTELRKHIKNVEQGTPPERVTKMKFNNERVKWVPVLHAVFYLTGVPADAVIGTYDTGIIDSDVIALHLGSKEQRPEGWRGEWPPTIQCKPVYYFDTQPVWNTLHEFDEL